MTITTTTNRLAYTGDNATTTFAFALPIFLAADLKVYLDGTLKTIVTDYTLSATPPQYGGLNVVFVSAPASAAEIVIVRDPALTQPLNLVANDPLPADELEKAYDILTLYAQRLRDLLDRSLGLSDTDVSGVSVVLPTPEANKLIGWDALGTSLANYTAAPGTLAVTGFAETLLGAANAGAFRTLIAALANTANTFSSGITIGTGNPLIFEGDTEDDNQTTITVTDPTADRTITIPDADVDLTYAILATEEFEGAAIRASVAEAQGLSNTTDFLVPLTMLAAIKSALNVTGSAPMFACRVWCSWDGTGTIAIDASGNVTSVTDNGTGDTTVTFTTAIEDVDYSVVTGNKVFATGGHQSSDLQFLTLYNGATKLVGSVRVNTQAGNANSGTDHVNNYIAVFR